MKENYKVIKDSISKSRLYWTLQCVGWGLFYLVYTSIAVLLLQFHWKIYASYGIMVLVGVVLTHGYRWHIKRNKWVRFGLSRLSLYVLFYSLFIGVVWACIILPISTLFVMEGDGSDQMPIGLLYFIFIFQCFLMVLGWSLIYFTFQFFMNFKKAEVEKWKLEAAVKDAELIALKSQVNPHFIFNSLNNIRSLVIEDQDKARDMITHLSDLLRYSLQLNKKEKVTVSEEMEMVRSYLKLESIQFEDRLNYDLNVESGTYEYKIPPMSLQILVENAIKHGIADLPGGGKISVTTKTEGPLMYVEVVNTGRLKNEISGTGIGLKNVTDRLELLFGKLSDFKIENFGKENVKAVFSVPTNI